MIKEFLIYSLAISQLIATSSGYDNVSALELTPDSSYHDKSNLNNNNLDIYNTPIIRGLTQDRELIDEAMKMLDLQSRIYLGRTLKYEALSRDIDNYGLAEGIVIPLITVWAHKIGNPDQINANQLSGEMFGDAIMPVLTKLNPDFKKSTELIISQKLKTLDPELQQYLESVDYNVSEFKSLKFIKLKNKLKQQQLERRIKASEDITKRSSNPRDNSFGQCLKRTCVDPTTQAFGKAFNFMQKKWNKDPISTTSEIATLVGAGGQIITKFPAITRFAKEAAIFGTASAAGYCIGTCVAKEIESSYQEVFSKELHKEEDFIEEPGMNAEIVLEEQQNDNIVKAEANVSNQIEEEKNHQEEAIEKSQKEIDRETEEARSQNQINELRRLGYDISWIPTLEEIEEEKWLDNCIENPDSCRLLGIGSSPEDIAIDGGGAMSLAGNDALNIIKMNNNERIYQSLKDCTDNKNQKPSFGVALSLQPNCLKTSRWQVENPTEYQYYKHRAEARLNIARAECRASWQKCNDYEEQLKAFKKNFPE